jgi:Zn finger protein HypA/HybF involved in hydrogenase expression
MLTCPNCNRSDLDGAKVVETGALTVFRVARNIEGEPLSLEESDFQCPDGHCLTLICPHCGEESQIDSDTDYSID